jgi:hypothetical protein
MTASGTVATTAAMTANHSDPTFSRPAAKMTPPPKMSSGPIMLPGRLSHETSPTAT